jgi:hypothetical protein
MVEVVKGKIVPVHAVKACGGCWGITQPFLKLDTCCWGLVSFTTRAGIPPPPPPKVHAHTIYTFSRFYQLWDSAICMNYRKTECSHNNNRA